MSVYISVELKRKIRKHFRFCCAYCRTAEELTVTTFEFEHIIPLSLDGKTTFDNLCLSCPSCNRYKATKQLIFNPKTNREIPLFHPQNDIWEQHFTWDKNATEIKGLTEVGNVTIITLKMNREQLIRVRKLWVKLGKHPPK